MTPPAPHLSPDGEPFGRYLRVAKLGSGGMGEVWKAWDTVLGRWVALKFPKGDESDIPRFLREARTAASLGHPNIASVFESDVIAGRNYIAMQFVDGLTLQEFPRSDRKLLLRLMRDAALAVAYAHGRGVVHRDLKPGNLMVERGRGGDPHLYVMDFGLARLLETGQTLSVSGAVVGTPVYMSPEQARAEAADERSDVYALGATLYELVVNRPPFLGKNLPELLEKAQKEDPRPPSRLDPSVDRDLETIILRCLEKDPARRYASAVDLAEDLGRYLKGEPIVARPPSRLYRAKKYATRHRVPLGMATLLCLGTVYGLYATLWPAAAFVETSPPGAAVRVDGKDAGLRTPCRVTLWPPGTHLLEFSADRYEKGSLEVTGLAGQQLRKRIDLVRATGYLTVITTPADTEAWIESAGVNRLLGRAPIHRIELPRGNHRLILRRMDHDELQELVDIRPDVETRVEKQLHPEMGEVDLTSNVDGVTAKLEMIDRAVEPPRFQPVPSFSNRLPTGRHRVKGEKENFFGQDRELVISKDAKARLHFTLSPMQLWSRPIRARTLRGSSFTVGKIVPVDFDGDGYLDVLLVDPGGVTLLSGRDGSTLWEYAGEVGFNAPVSLADIDGDGILDVVVAGASRVVAISGRNGRPLWTFVATEKNQVGDGAMSPLIADLDGDGVPDCISGWREGGLQAVSGKDGSLLWKIGGSNSMDYYLGGVRLLPGTDGFQQLLLRKGQSIWRIGAKDGIRLQELMVEDPKVYGVLDAVDLDGDGTLDIVTYGEQLTAISGSSGVTLWKAATAKWITPLKHGLIDLDRDGFPDYLVVDGSSLLALSGKSGHALWETPIGSTPFTSAHFMSGSGPEKTPEVLVASAGTVSLYSGKDGTLIWKSAFQDDKVTGIAVCDRAGNHLPGCIVTTSRGKVSALAHSNGSELWSFKGSHAMSRVPPVVADINGDGVDDVVVWGEDAVYVLSGNSQPVTWEVPLNESLSGPVQAADVDGDGVPDCVFPMHGTSALRAVSGLDGAVLWTSERGQWTTANPHVTGPANLDGDPLPDWVISDTNEPVVAISGKTHAALWKAPIPQAICPPVLADLDGDGRDDVLVAARAGNGTRVLGLSGRDGHVLWEVTEPGSLAAPLRAADFNHDSVRDCFLRTNNMVVLSGKDGSVLWKVDGKYAGDFHQRPVLADLDGDGVPEFVTDRVPAAYSGKTGKPLWSTGDPRKGSPTGGLDLLGDCNGDGTPDLLNAFCYRGGPPDNAMTLRLAVISGRDGSEICRFGLPERPLTLESPQFYDAFVAHEHSDPMGRGWRVIGIPPSAPGGGGIVGVRSHVTLFDPRDGRLMQDVRGTSPLSVARANDGRGSTADVFIGEGKRVLKVGMKDTPPGAFLDAQTQEVVPEGFPAVLGALRRELKGFPDGRGVPALCHKLLEKPASTQVRHFLLSTAAKYEYLMGRADATRETLSQWKAEGGNSYLMHALLYFHSKSPGELAAALSLSPIETCGLLHELVAKTDSTTSETAMVLARIPPHFPHSVLAKAGACLLAGQPTAASEYLQAWEEKGHSEEVQRLRGLFLGRLSVKAPEEVQLRAIRQLLPETSLAAPAETFKSEIAEAAILDAHVFLTLGERDRAADCIDAVLGRNDLSAVWRNALEQLLINLRGD